MFCKAFQRRGRDYVLITHILSFYFTTNQLINLLLIKLFHLNALIFQKMGLFLGLLLEGYANKAQYFFRPQDEQDPCR